MPKYTKKWWEDAKQFKTQFIEYQDVERMMAKCNNDSEKICLLLLYYTGARPSEIVEMKATDIGTEKNLIKIQIPTKKGGIGRTIYLEKHLGGIAFLAAFASVRKGNLIDFNKPWQIRDFIYRVSDNQLTAYFFRHNRMSKLSKAGASLTELKYFKGAKRAESVEDYIHVGGQETRRLSKLNR